MKQWISYAQQGEDILLARALPDVEKGFYVDVGAFDPWADSVTKHFYDNGWSGINVEPGPGFPRLMAERPRDITLDLAVSEFDGHASLYRDPNPCLWSLAPVDGPSETVRTQSLRTLLSIHAPSRTIDFLKVDVEGHELQVVRGNDWQRFRPRILCIESTDLKYREWESLLSGYLFAFWDGVNRFYIRAEEAWRLQFFDHPACSRDGFTHFWEVQAAHLMAERGEKVNVCVHCGKREPGDHALCPTCITELSPELVGTR